MCVNTKHNFQHFVFLKIANMLINKLVIVALDPFNMISPQCFSKVSIFFLSNTSKCIIVLRISFMLMWLNINCGKNMDHECISFLCSMHGSLYLYKQHLGTLGSSCMIEVFLMLEVLHVPILILVFECTTYTTVFMLRPLHSQALCFGVSKWKIFVWQLTHQLCKTSQNNPMMIMFLKDEMHWKQLC